MKLYLQKKFKKKFTYFFVFNCLIVLNMQSQGHQKAINRIDSLSNVLIEKSKNKNSNEKLDSITTELSCLIFDFLTYNFDDPKFALKYGKNLTKIAQKHKNKKMLTNVLRKIGNLYLRQFLYDKATEYYLLSLKIAEEIPDEVSMAHSLGNLGNVYARMAEISNPRTNYKIALDYQRNAYLLLIKNNSANGKIANSLINTSVIYKGIGQHKKAIEILNRAADLYRTCEQKNGLDLSNTNLAETYLDFGKKTGNKTYFSIAENYLTDKMLNQEESTRAADIWTLKGEICFRQNKLEEAQFFLYKAYKKAKAKKNIIALKNSATLLAELFDIKKNYEKKIEFLKGAVAAKNMLLDERTNKQIVTMNAQFENEKKENELELLLKNKKLQEAEISEQNTLLNIFIISSLLLAISVFLLYNQFKIKQKLNLQLDETNKKLTQKNIYIEKQKEKITNNITYAELIQHTIIDEQSLDTYFSDYFIFYSPKAIVSGDFYWCTKVGEKIILAVADCTGHGVPGAFMSILGNMLLNQIVKEKKNTTPAQILNLLNIALTKTLQQDRENAQSDDGMDIAICTIDYTSKTVEYAGAFQPMYIIKNKELQILKPNIKTIGGNRILLKRNKIKEKDFINHSIQIENNMSIYLFSDGYADQFDSANQKKYGSIQLQNLLLHISELNMTEQKEQIIEKHEQWKKHQNQTDDILLLGIRL